MVTITHSLYIKLKIYEHYETVILQIEILQSKILINCENLEKTNCDSFPVLAIIKIFKYCCCPGRKLSLLLITKLYIFIVVSSCNPL